MSNNDTITEQEHFTQTILEKVGPTESLLMTMRLVLLIGQRKPEDAEVITATKDALAAIKRLGELTNMM